MLADGSGSGGRGTLKDVFDALSDMLGSAVFEVGEGEGGELGVADWTLVFLC